MLLGAIMPELLSHYRTTYTSGGFLALLGSIGFVVGVPITTRLMRRLHYKFILSGAALAVAIAQTGVLFVPPFFLLGIFFVLNGMGAASEETAVASYIMEQFVGRRAISMSRLEVAFGIGALSLPALAGVFIAMHAWRFTSLFIAIIALILTVVWQVIGYSLPSHRSSEDSERRDAGTSAPPVFNGMLSKYSVLMLFLLMIFIYVGVEGSINSFLPSIFTVYLKTQPYLASMSSAAFWGSMVLGRFAIGWIVRRVSYERYLFSSILMASVFFLGLITAKQLWVSYLSILGVGLSLSAVYSITMVYANHTFSGMERTVTSSVTACAGVGGAIFPAVIGFSMDHLPAKQVLWMIQGSIIVLLISFLVIYFSLHIIRQHHFAKDGT